MGQIGTIKVKAAGGIVIVPSCHWEQSIGYNTGDSQYYPWWSQALRVYGLVGQGFIPLVMVTDDHALPIRVQTQDGILALCDISLDCLEVTFGGLAGDLAVWNGAHIIRWEDGGWPNRWDLWTGPGTYLEVWCIDHIFRAVVTAGMCLMRWIKSACTPCGVYSEDLDTCGESEGATCIVTAAECP